MPSVPHPGPPPIPEQQIIQKFAANEDAAKKAYDDYTFTQTIRIEELSIPAERSRSPASRTSSLTASDTGTCRSRSNPH